MTRNHPTKQRNLPDTWKNKHFNRNNRPKKEYFLETTGEYTKVEQHHIPHKIMIETMVLAGERYEIIKKKVFEAYKTGLYDSHVEGFEDVEYPDRDPGIDKIDIGELHKEAIRRVRDREKLNELNRKAEQDRGKLDNDKQINNDSKSDVKGIGNGNTEDKGKEE